MSSMETREEPAECAELAQLTDFEEILEHEMLGCPVCMRIKTQKALGNHIPSVQAPAPKMKEEAIDVKPIVQFDPSNSKIYQKKPFQKNVAAKRSIKPEPMDMDLSVCEELESITDFQERVEHEMLGCPTCMKINRQKALGQDIKSTAESTRKVVNYGDHAVKPINIRFTSTPVSNPLTKPNERKRKMDSDDQSEPKKRLYDKLIVRDLVRMEGLEKKEAAMRLVEQKRRPKMDEGDRVAPDQMPWQPSGNVLHLPRECYSCLLPIDHRRYVAIISNFLSASPNFRFEMNKLEIEAMDDRLKQEREQFNKAAFEAVKQWKKSPFRYQAMGSFDMFNSRELAKYKSVLGNSSFVEKVRSVDWPRLYHRDDQMTNSNFRLMVSELLQTGKQLRVYIPDVRRKCAYNMNPSVIEQHFALEPAVKISIEKDEQAIEWALEKGIEYIMDGSTVRHLMSNRWPNRNQTFANRVSVVQRVQRGSIQRVVFVSKPLLASQLELLYLTRQFIKWTAKCELRSKFMPNSSKLRDSKATLREMLSLKSQSTVVNKKEIEAVAVDETKMEISDEPMKKMKFEAKGIEESDDEDCPLRIEENFDITSQSTTMASSSVLDERKQLKPEENDILGGILDSMGLNMNSGCTSVDAKGQSQSFMEVIEGRADDMYTSRTKRYSVMKFDNEGKHQILVRTSNHGVDQNGIAVSVTVKTEYLPEIGSDKLHLEEELWNLVTGIVKGSAEQCNLHIYPRIGHCLQMKRISGNSRICSISTELKQLLESRTARMCVLMDAFEKLEAGEYLIYPEGNSMTILKEADVQMDPSQIPSDEIEFVRGTTVCNHASLVKKSLAMPPRFSNDIAKNWNGLNPHFPLVWHITSGRIPGSFYPRRRDNLNWRPDEQFKLKNQQGSGGRGRGNRGVGRGNRGVSRGSYHFRGSHADSSESKEVNMEQDRNT